jgi:hypothetical protein
MASPYFQPAPQARVQIDTSPLIRGAEAQARGMASIGENLGTMVGTGLNKYFEKKKVDIFIERAAQSEQAESFYKAQGLPMPADVNEIKKDLEAGIKEAGGITAFKAANAADIAQKRAEQKAGQQQQQHSMLMQQYDLKLKGLERAEDQLTAKDSVYAHLLGNNASGKRNMDSMNPLDGFEMTPQNAAVAAEAMQTLKIGRHGDGLVNAMMHVAPQGFLGTAGRDKWANNIRAQANLPGMTIDQQTKLNTALADRVHDPKIVNEQVNKEWAAHPFLKTLEDSYFGEMTNFESLMDQAMGDYIVNPDGSLIGKIKNPSSANVAVMYLARIAQGGGVLSDKDVGRIKGGSDWESSWDRFKERWFGSDTTDEKWAEKHAEEALAGAKGAMVSFEDLHFMRELGDSLTEKNSAQRKKYVVPLLQTVTNQFPGLSIEQVASLTMVDETSGLTLQELLGTKTTSASGGAGGGAPGVGINNEDISAVQQFVSKGMTQEQIVQEFAKANPEANPTAIAANINHIISSMDPEKRAALGIGENRTAFKGTPFEKEVPRGSAPAGSLQAQVDREGDALVGGAKKTAGYAAAVKAGHVATKIGTGNAAGNMYEVLGQGKVKDLARRKATAASIRNFGGTSASTNAQLLRSMGVGQKDADKALKKGDKAVRSLVRKRIRERAKKFAKNKGAKAVLKKIASPKMIVRGIPVVGWAMLLYDIADLADSATSAPSPEDIKEMTKGMSEAEIDLFKAEYAKLQKDGEISSKVGYFSEGGGWDKRYSFGPR